MFGHLKALGYLITLGGCKKYNKERGVSSISFDSPINKSLANFPGPFPNITRVVQKTNVWACPQVTIGLAAAWLMALMLCLPPLFRVAPYNYNVALAGCAPDFATGNAALWYSAVYTTLTLILPAALILGCNIKVQ